jgi:hypothetical protein
MNPEDAPPTDEERREAELLARALEDRAPDVSGVEDAVGAARMIRASQHLELTELRARVVLEGAWRTRSQRAAVPIAGFAAAAAAAVIAFVASTPHRPTHLPPPDVELVRAQLAAARAGADPALAQLEQARANYRGELYAALRRAYGGRP